jgi:hypothetical protein
MTSFQYDGCSCVSRSPGESVPTEEQAVKESVKDALSSSSSTHALPTLPQLPTTVGATGDDHVHLEQEKQKLYQQLDDKVLTC